MKEYITLGPTPADEDCAQMGNDNYSSQSRLETRAYIAQLRRLFGENAQLGSKEFPHDFGSYREVLIWYDPDNEEELDLALKIDGEIPARWDEEAKAFLRAHDYAIKIKE